MRRSLRLAPLVVLMATPACGGGASKPSPPQLLGSAAKPPVPAASAPTAAAPPAPDEPPPPGHVNQLAPNGDAAPELSPPVTVRRAPVHPRLQFMPLSRLAPQPSVHAPPAPAPGDEGCAVVEVDGVRIPIDCGGDDYGRIEGAASALISNEELKDDDTGALPEKVDHRLDGTEGPVRGQGKVGACTAFSLASAVDHALARWSHGTPGNVSAMEVWSRYHTPLMRCAEKANLRRALLGDASWPYEPGDATAWYRLPRDDHGCGAALELPADKRGERAVAEITSVHELAPASDVSLLKSALARGADVWLSIRVDHHFGCRHGSCFQLPGSMELVIPDYDAKKSKKQGGHAVLLAGYEDSPFGTFFLVHNSWGTKWANKGYAFIHEETLERNITSAFTVDAHAVDPQPNARPRARAVAVSCPAGRYPDSITSQCVPKCGDGSPRHNGVCATNTSCTKGHVNLFGECVVAAPHKKGRARAAGQREREGDGEIDYACGPGGCIYTLPGPRSGAPSGAPDAARLLSCPAPRFRLSRTPSRADGRGYGCME